MFCWLTCWASTSEHCFEHLIKMARVQSCFLNMLLIHKETPYLMRSNRILRICYFNSSLVVPSVSIRQCARWTILRSYLSTVASPKSGYVVNPIFSRVGNRYGFGQAGVLYLVSILCVIWWQGVMQICEQKTTAVTAGRRMFRLLVSIFPGSQIAV